MKNRVCTFRYVSPFCSYSNLQLVLCRMLMVGSLTWILRAGGYKHGSVNGSVWISLIINFPLTLSCRLHPRRRVDRVSKQTVSGHLHPNHACGTRTCTHKPVKRLLKNETGRREGEGLHLSARRCVSTRECRPDVAAGRSPWTPGCPAPCGRCPPRACSRFCWADRRRPCTRRQWSPPAGQKSELLLFSGIQSSEENMRLKETLKEKGREFHHQTQTKDGTKEENPRRKWFTRLQEPI